MHLMTPTISIRPSESLDAPLKAAGILNPRVYIHGYGDRYRPISIPIPVGKFLDPYPYGYGYGGYGYGLPKFIHIHIHPLAYTIPGMEINLGPAAAGWRDPYEGELGQ